MQSFAMAGVNGELMVIQPCISTGITATILMGKDRLKLSENENTLGTIEAFKAFKARTSN